MDGVGPTGPVSPDSKGLSRPDRPQAALSRCIGIDARRFADEYWSRQPLFTPAAPTAGFDDLLSVASVDELLSRRGLRTPFIRMAKQGKVIAAASYTRSGGTGAGVADQVADDRVLELVADGATLVLQALHRNWPPLIDFGTRLAGELGHPVQINAYVTPAQNQGFAAHYDTHDVFVLQVSGSKRWLVHEPVILDPLPSQAWEQRKDAVAARAAEQPLLEVTLGPGDALYLPRGYLHSAVALGELSIHLTVGVHPVTRHALARLLLTEAAQDRQLRRSLPMGGDLTDPAVLAAELAETTDALLGYTGDGHCAVDAVARGLATELAESTRPAPITPLGQLATLDALDPDRPLRLRPGLRTRLERTSAGLTLHALNRKIDLSVLMEPALKLALSGDPVTAAQLPGLEPSDQLELARRLLQAAVLVPISGG